MSSQLKPLRPDDVKWLVVHCSGSRCNHPFTVEGLINTGMQRFGQPSYYHKCNKIKSSLTKSADNQCDTDDTLQNYF